MEDFLWDDSRYPQASQQDRHVLECDLYRGPDAEAFWFVP
jgi:hypothetical protein